MYVCTTCIHGLEIIPQNSGLIGNSIENHLLQTNIYLASLKSIFRYSQIKKTCFSRILKCNIMIHMWSVCVGKLYYYFVPLISYLQLALRSLTAHTAMTWRIFYHTSRWLCCIFAQTRIQQLPAYSSVL